MKELTNFPILLNAIFNITSGIRNIQSPFSSPDTALNAGASPPAAAVTAAAESILPEILHATIGDITSAQWASLNASVGGRLHADGAPYARACFDQYDGDGSSTADQEACQELQAGYLNEKYRLSHFGSAMLVCGPLSKAILPCGALMGRWITDCIFTTILDPMGNMSSYW